MTYMTLNAMGGALAARFAGKVAVQTVLLHAFKEAGLTDKDVENIIVPQRFGGIVTGALQVEARLPDGFDTDRFLDVLAQDLKALVRGNLLKKDALLGVRVDEEPIGRLKLMVGREEDFNVRGRPSYTPYGQQAPAAA